MGLRGSGKSTLARAIGEHAGVASSDLDPMVLDRLGVSTVHEAWEGAGEPAFREAETSVLRDVLDGDQRCVLALGGGTPTAPGAADLLRDAMDRGLCTLVYLRLLPEQLRERLSAHDPDWPSLTGAASGDDPLDEIREVFAARDPPYRSLAQHEYAPIYSIDQDARAILDLWR